jgi:hypothetical protein
VNAEGRYNERNTACRRGDCPRRSAERCRVTARHDAITAHLDNLIERVRRPGCEKRADAESGESGLGDRRGAAVGEIAGRAGDRDEAAQPRLAELVDRRERQPFLFALSLAATARSGGGVVAAGGGSDTFRRRSRGWWESCRKPYAAAQRPKLWAIP